jgi:Holliday junction resolvasome RuvABC endonuclease subunit
MARRHRPDTARPAKIGQFFGVAHDAVTEQRITVTEFTPLPVS